MIIFIKLYLLPKSFLKNNNALFRLSHLTKHECITKQSLLKLLRCDEQVIKLHIKLLDFFKVAPGLGTYPLSKGTLQTYIEKTPGQKQVLPHVGNGGLKPHQRRKRCGDCLNRYAIDAILYWPRVFCIENSSPTAIRECNKQIRLN